MGIMGIRGKTIRRKSESGREEPRNLGDELKNAPAPPASPLDVCLNFRGF